MRRVAVVGAGVAGLTAAYRLAPHAHVTLFEAGTDFGGHAHTVDVVVEGQPQSCDIAFSSLSEKNYRTLLALFRELGVQVVPQRLSFSVQVPAHGLVWAGPGLNAVFAQRLNLFRPAYWVVLKEFLRLQREATRAAASGSVAGTFGGFLAGRGFGPALCERFVLPMLASVWGCSLQEMARFPAEMVLRFGGDHGLFDVSSKEPWSTVLGGSRTYVQQVVGRLRERGHRVLSGTPVLAVRRVSDEEGTRVELDTARGRERFDHVVLACHADQALRLLQDASTEERNTLGTFRFRRNVSVVHTDASVMPAQQAAWSAWNYEQAPGAPAEVHARGTSVHYWLNRLQPLALRTPLFASLNPCRPIDERLVLARHEYEHPLFDLDTARAQQRLPALQGARHTWFCGAWTGDGFHEAGARSAQTVAVALGARLREDQQRPPTQRPLDMAA
jgi:predicted NAD/FAD-binding protein